MREYLFRGKCGSKWHYGDLYTQSNTPQIIAYNKHYDKMDTAFVDPETVGQYTGMKDCKRTEEYPEGQMIFEGDIIDCWSEGVNAQGTVQQRRDGLWIIYPAWQKHIMWGVCPDEDCNITLEVIGNIYDNPELLKEGGGNDENPCDMRCAVCWSQSYFEAEEEGEADA